MNEFYKDSFLLFKKISKKIVDKQIISDIDIIENTLFFALGAEKLLKGILSDINPLFILEQSEFKNSFAVLYKNKLIKSSENSSDIASKPNADVIAFQNSVLRTALVSQTAYDFKNTLFNLKDARDIIVHHNFSKLDLQKLKLMLERDFYPMLNAFSAEFDLGGQTNFFNNLHSQLALISSALQNDIESKIKLEIEATYSKWNVTKKAAGQKMEDYKRLTIDKLQQNIFAYPTTCPCCKNYAVVTTLPIFEFNHYLKQDIQIGLQIKSLFCCFCKLSIDDYDKLDFLKVNPEIDLKNSVIDRYFNEINAV